MQVFGGEKTTSLAPNRKAKWCKMQLLFLKTNILKRVKGQKKWQFTYFMAYIFARTERKSEPFRKIKGNDLSFKLMSF